MDNMIYVAIIGGASGLLASLPISYLTYRLAVKKYENENLYSNQVRAALLTMLQSDKYDARSLDQMKTVLPGVDENDLRKFLVEIGAISFQDKKGRELWGSADRNNRANKRQSQI